MLSAYPSLITYCSHHLNMICALEAYTNAKSTQTYFRAATSPLSPLTQDGVSHIHTHRQVTGEMRSAGFAIILVWRMLSPTSVTLVTKHGRPPSKKQGPIVYCDTCVPPCEVPRATNTLQDYELIQRCLTSH